MESPLSEDDLAALAGRIDESKKAYRSKSTTTLSREARLPALQGHHPLIDARPVEGGPGDDRGVTVAIPDARLLQFLRPETFSSKAATITTIALPYEPSHASAGE